MLVNRVGTFLILIGVGLIGLFVLSDIAKQPAWNFFAYGAILLLVGIFLWVRAPSQPGPPADRFRTLRKMRGKQPKK